jgi:hypothetical protein
MRGADRTSSLTASRQSTSTTPAALLTLGKCPEWSNIVQLRRIKQRLPRLREMVAELILDVLTVKKVDGPLLDGEKQAYLVGIEDAIARLDQARVVLGKAIRRIEEWR